MNLIGMRKNGRRRGSGEVTLIRCYGIDPSDGLESFVKFAMNNDSGGLFLDMAIHDIDLVRWFTGQEVEQVWAIGKMLHIQN